MNDGLLHISSSCGSSIGERILALTGATVFVDPVAPAVLNASVLIDGPKIVAVGRCDDVDVPATAPRIDCSGRTIAAGFWNSHVHFFERKWAEVAAIPGGELSAQLQAMSMRFGFTSVFDLGSQWTNTKEIRRRIESGEVLGPRIYSTGEGLIPPGALPNESVLATMGVMSFPAPEIASPAVAAAAAKRLLDDGVDGIKLFASSPRSAALDEDTMRAAVKEAHRAGKPVFVHPNSGADVVSALNVGVDVIAHTTPMSGAWEQSLLEAAEERKAALAPTLMLWKFFLRHDRRSIQSSTVATAIGQLHAWHEAGATVLFGTDLGAVEYDPTAEYLMMADAGMGFREILASLTTAPAARFGEAARSGRVAAGFDADLVVLNGDPSTDIHSLTEVRYTIRGGQITYQAPQERMTSGTTRKS